MEKMFRQTTITIVLLVVIFVSLNYAAPISQNNDYSSDMIIRGRKKGKYIDNIRDMCKRTLGKIRTTKEIAACNMYASIAGTGYARNVDNFILR